MSSGCCRMPIQSEATAQLGQVRAGRVSGMAPQGSMYAWGEVSALQEFFMWQVGTTPSANVLRASSGALGTCLFGSQAQSSNCHSGQFSFQSPLRQLC
jgi:hypothetical protein